MLLVVNACLTAIAWSRGWRAYALLPIVCACALEFSMGFGLGSVVGPVDPTDPRAALIVNTSLVLDLLTTAVLIFMSARHTQRASLQPSAPAVTQS